MSSRLISGLDLGKVADHSALAVVERTKLEKPVARRRYRYALRWLQAWELGTRYTPDPDRPELPSIVGDVRKRFDTPALKWTALAVDFTGVGNPVVEQIRAVKVPARITPVLITAGHQITIDPKTRECHVPKKELVSTLLVLMEAGLLKYPSPESQRDKKFAAILSRLQRELTDFRVKVTKAKNETFAADASQHDDLVLALSLACWLGENCGPGDPSGITVPDGKDVNSVAGAPAGVFATGNGV